MSNIPAPLMAVQIIVPYFTRFTSSHFTKVRDDWGTVWSGGGGGEEVASTLYQGVLNVNK